MNIRCRDFVFQAFGYEEVVDTPANVAGSRICPERPPGIVTVPFFKESKGVDKPGINKGLKASAFFIGKAFLAAVWAGVSKIEFGVSHVKVPTKNDRLCLL